MLKGNLLPSRGKISIFLTTVAVLLWSHSIFCTKLKIGFYGLFHSLPLTFFIALALLTIASTILWVFKERYSGLLCLQLLLFISALWLIPVVTGGSPPFTDFAYRNLGMVDYILRQGHFDPMVLFYQSWPGAFILVAIAVKICSIDLEPLLGVFPFFMQLLYLLPLYIFLKNILGKARSNHCWAGAWLFYLANWIAQDYFSPQAIALFLLLTFLVLITSAPIWEGKSRTYAFLCLLVLVFSALAITHLLTALATLCILVALCLIKRSKKLAIVVLLSLLLLGSWNLNYINRALLISYNSNAISPESKTNKSKTNKGYINHVLLASHRLLTFNPGVIGKREIIGHLRGSKSHIAVVKTRILLSSIFAVIGFFGFLISILRKKFDIAIPVLVIALAPLVLLPLSGNYGEELLHRLYLFSLAPMACFGVKLLCGLNIKRRMVFFIFCSLLIVCIPLHVVAHYGNEIMDYLPSKNIAGLHFFHNNTTRGYITWGWPMCGMKNAEKYQRISFNQLRLQNNILVVKEQFDKLDKRLPHYVIISQREREYYRFFFGKPRFIDKIQLKLESSVNYDLIYNSAGLKLYVNENIEAEQCKAIQ